MNADADVVIVGAGMAGLSAGIWAGRLGLKSKIIEKDERAGGQLHWIQDVIPDYPGLELRGTDFARTLCDQARRSASIETGIAVQKILPFQDAPEAGDLYVLETTGGILSARAVLISTGLRRRTLPAVRAFHGTGIYYTSQPRDQFKGDSLVIAGGGDGAVENAILLQAQWKKIYIVHRGAALRARPALADHIRNHSHIEVLLETEIVSVTGDPGIRGVVLSQGGKTRTVDADRLLVKVGFEAENTLLSSGGHHFAHAGSWLDSNDEQMALHSTGDMPLDSRPIWVAGDVCTPRDPSLAVAAGQACIAMRSIERYLRSKPSLLPNRN
jgi:thioredoxin reductase (NADPH)